MNDKTMIKLLYPGLYKIWMEDFSTPQSFGEDGGVAIGGSYDRYQAYQVLNKYYIDEIGEPMHNFAKPHDLIISYLHPPSEKELREEDWDWVISRSKPSLFKVWAWWG